MANRKLDGSETLSEAKEFIAEKIQPLLAEFTDKASATLEASFDMSSRKRAFHLEVRIYWDLHDRRDWI